MQPIYLDYNASTPIDPRVGYGHAPFTQGSFRQPFQRSLGEYSGESRPRSSPRAGRHVARQNRWNASNPCVIASGTHCESALVIMWCSMATPHIGCPIL